jgi:metal-responsive CopG/Arc/MetJ family transcriptional regulator
MGRPPLHVIPTVIRLTKEMADRIDAMAGKNRRAEFIREAVERELKRRERQKDKPE